MFGKNNLTKKEMDSLKKECFETRKALIVPHNISGTSRVRGGGCINLLYSIEDGILNPWKLGMKPEDACRVTSAKVVYCDEFDSFSPDRHVCQNTSCPMYNKYQKYLDAYKKLQLAKKR